MAKEDHGKTVWLAKKSFHSLHAPMQSLYSLRFHPHCCHYLRPASASRAHTPQSPRLKTKSKRRHTEGANVIPFAPLQVRIANEILPRRSRIWGQNSERKPCRLGYGVAELLKSRSHAQGII
ncbi:uncharacterized protein APUU_70702S [Aspergillus puulaauensis]|uniref:Uncharacterized protein n=1 Tax=Aspergillus puulaauensis TaxID=1220207 RepID=A0A7R7XX97_9EURO|nr:uncharacterized protein APUU_70702S [Aspergillus puulaauensis]BCS29132.1 hypothetical protein APUU_70702S [Aspergillus puulaauensis]